ncbi:MAG: SDR family oxidoreductase [Candidatus Omnitrophota bacterium]|nr:SDR family oxidoreductase [Candidatus Omnitrophota bacterium]MDZ4242604.1 UDP-glucuronic acid decarboxylase family protein [Candidatus Omnitrophota bacterium]
MAERRKVVVITGGAGFLGSHLCDRFLAEGNKVICVDNLITGSEDNIRHHRRNRNFRFVRHDVSKPFNISGPVDAILHFASPASPVDYLTHPIPTLKVGSLGTHNTLGLAKLKKSRFLLASTSEVYGDPQVHPQKETYWGHVNPIGPRGVYDEAKRFAEAMTMAYHRYHGVDIRIIRIFNTYGPRMRLKDGRVVPNFIDQALHGQPLTVYGSGKQTRSFCYYSDLVEGIARMLRGRITGPVNLGNSSEFTILEFAKLVLKISGARSKIVFRPLPTDDPKQRRPDSALARKALKWQPKVRLEDGLQETLAWFHAKLGCCSSCKCCE